MKIGPKVCVTVEEHPFQDGVEMWTLSSPSGQLSFSSPHLFLLEPLSKSREDGGQKWRKCFCVPMWGGGGMGIVWRVWRTRIHTFLPHMRTQLTAACHSLRATNFKDYCLSGRHLLWWKRHVRIITGAIWFKKWKLPKIFVLWEERRLWGDKKIRNKRTQWSFL